MITPEQTATTIKFVRNAIAKSFKVSSRQLPKVLFHGILLSCIIAGFWLLDSLKDPILASTVGIEYQPLAKLLSVVTTLIVVCIYDFLTSIVSKQALFQVLSCVFGLTVMIISALLSDPIIGIKNANVGPQNLLGWLTFFTIEAYGSLMVALFWSFTNSVMNLEQAKGAYGLIIATAQVGAITGSTLATNSTAIGISRLVLIGSLMIFSISLLSKIYHITFQDKETKKTMNNRVRTSSETSSIESPISSPQKPSEDLRKTLLRVNKTQNVSVPEPIIPKRTLFESFKKVFGGFYEGLSIVLRYRYTLLLLGVSCLYEIVVTILDYQFKILGSISINETIDPLSAKGFNPSDGGDRFANLLGHFGQFTNVLSFLMSFFGFSYLVHNYGVRFSLMLFPLVLFTAVIITYLVPSLWVLFVLVSVLKAMIFSLHDPVKELLYIPTNEAIKFKAKAWIDVFGARFAKATGSILCHLAGGEAVKLRQITEIPSILVAAMVILVTLLIGLQFENLIHRNEIIGSDMDPEQTNVTKAQNEFDFPGFELGERDNSDENGLKPGDVGYSGYDPQLFEGVFDDGDLGNDDEDAIGRI